jgi:hypothetical protein
MLNNHGSIFIVTKTEYLHQVALAERLFFSVETAFLLVATATFAAAARSPQPAIRARPTRRS